MGNENSSLDKPKVGYHVLHVHPNGPGKSAFLVSFFDFIISADGIFFEKEDTKFVDILKNKIGKEVKLKVYNVRTETIREVILVPSDSWGGNGLAGISIRFCSFEAAHEFVWHVLQVYPNSPASIAGLQPRTDYIVGTPELLFSDSEDFFTLININEGKPLPLYVYSTITDEVRLITIIPNQKWGGTGSLGCDVGFGILHRIPRIDPSSLERKSPQQQESISPKLSNPGFIQAEIPTSPQSPHFSHPSQFSGLNNSPTISNQFNYGNPQQNTPYLPGFTTPSFTNTNSSNLDSGNLGEPSSFVNSYPSPVQQQRTQIPKPSQNTLPTTEFQEVRL